MRFNFFSGSNFLCGSYAVLAMSLGLLNANYARADVNAGTCESVVCVKKDTTGPVTENLPWSDTETEKGWKDMITVSVSSSPTINASGDTDINSSHVELKFENKEFRKLINDIGIESYSNIDYVFSVDVRISGVPTFLKNGVQSKLDKRVDDKVDAGKNLINNKVSEAYDQVHSFELTKQSELDLGLQAQRPVAMSAAMAQVDAMFAANPNFQFVPPAQQEAMRQHAYSLAANAVDQALAQFKQQKLAQLSQGINAKNAEIAGKGAAATASAIAQGNAKKAEISDRLDEIQLETSVQEVAFVVAKSVGDGKALVFAKVGKFNPETGGKVNNNYQTELEENRPVNSPVQRGVGIASTGAVDLGANIILKKGSQVQLDVIMAHDRPQWVSGQQYTGIVVSMLEGDYQKQKDFYAINSVILRTMYKSTSGEVYGTVGSFDGKIQGQIGIRLLITDKLNLNVDLTKGNRAYLKEGASGFLVYKLIPRLAFYGGVEYVKGFVNPGISKRDDGSVDYVTSNIGVKVNLLNTEIKMCSIKVDVKGEGVYYISQSGIADAVSSDWDFVSGAQLDASCGATK